MTRDVRTKYLEPIGLAEAKGSFGLIPKAKFGWFIAKTFLGSFNPWVGSLDGVRNLTPFKQRLIQRGLRRNRALGRRILMIIARYQKSFMDQSFLLGDEGGIFDQLSVSTASLCYAIALDRSEPEYATVAEALDLEATLLSKGRAPSPDLYRMWADIGQMLMDPNNILYRDLIGDIEVSRIPLDPRHVDRYI